MKYVFDTNVLFNKTKISKYVNGYANFIIDGSIVKTLKDEDGFIPPTVFAEIINQILIEKGKVSKYSITIEDKIKYETKFNDFLKKVSEMLEKYVVKDIEVNVIPEIIINDLNFFNNPNNFRNIKDKVISYEVLGMKKLKKWDEVRLVTDNIKDFKDMPKTIEHPISLKQFRDVTGKQNIVFKNAESLFNYIQSECIYSGGLSDYLFKECISINSTETILEISAFGYKKGVPRNMPLSKKELSSLIEYINVTTMKVVEVNELELKSRYLQIEADRYRDFQDEQYREYREELHLQHLDEIQDEHQDRKTSFEEEYYSEYHEYVKEEYE